MRPVSETFLRTLRGTHTMNARARVVTGFPTGVNPTGTEIPIFGGDVQLDATADVRASVDLDTSAELWPADATSLLAPYGNELFIERGLVLPNGDFEWVSQGYFRVESPEQQQVPTGQIRVAGRDRMAGIIDAKLLAPTQFPIGTSVEDIFTGLVTEVYPTAVILFDFDAANVTFPQSHIADQDRYAFLRDIARSLGKEMYFDHEGKLRVYSAPDPGDPVFLVNHGRDGVLVEMARKLDRDGVFNAVVATGESPSDTVDPARAVALDANPDSPTYFFGPFGPVPRFYSSPFITNQQGAREAAAAMLTKSLGLPYTVSFKAVPNPALEPLDPVEITYADDARVERHVLEKVTIPLTAEATMSATTREQTSILVEIQ